MSISSSSEFLFNYIHCKRAGLHKKGNLLHLAAAGTSPDFLLGWILALKNILERKFDGSREEFGVKEVRQGRSTL